MYSGDVRRRALAEVALGASARRPPGGWASHGTRSASGAPPPGSRSRPAGGGAPCELEPAGPRTSPRSRLTLAHRVLIAAGLREGRRARAIGRELGFAHTTVAREVRRAARRTGHRAVESSAPLERASSARGSSSATRACARRSSGGSPCAGRRRRCRQASSATSRARRMRVSHETIYWRSTRRGGSLREELEVELVLRSGPLEEAQVAAAGLPAGQDLGRGGRDRPQAVRGRLPRGPRPLGGRPRRGVGRRATDARRALDEVPG